MTRLLEQFPELRDYLLTFWRVTLLCWQFAFGIIIAICIMFWPIGAASLLWGHSATWNTWQSGLVLIGIGIGFTIVIGLCAAVFQYIDSR